MGAAISSFTKKKVNQPAGKATPSAAYETPRATIIDGHKQDEKVTTEDSKPMTAQSGRSSSDVTTLCENGGSSYNGSEEESEESDSGEESEEEDESMARPQHMDWLRSYAIFGGSPPNVKNIETSQKVYELNNVLCYLMMAKDEAIKLDISFKAASPFPRYLPFLLQDKQAMVAQYERRGNLSNYEGYALDMARKIVQEVEEMLESDRARARVKRNKRMSSKSNHSAAPASTAAPRSG